MLTKYFLSTRSLFNSSSLKFLSQLVTRPSINQQLTRKMSAISKPVTKDDHRTRLVWIDLEMSGLNIDVDHILEIACLITDQELNIVAEGHNIIIHQEDKVLDGMDAWCTATHGNNGLIVAVKNSLISLEKAEQMTLDFITQHTPVGKCALAGNSVHADKVFLDKYMKKITNHLHYRIVDVSTIKELTYRWYPQVTPFPKRDHHRALSDIKESIAELNYYRKAVFK